MGTRGPAPKDVKHGRTPTTGSDWTDVEDVPFEGAPALPQLGGRRKWHQWTMDWYAIASTMPHCVLWRRADWHKLHDLARLKDAQYKSDDPKTSADTEIRRRETELGMGIGALQALRIRYVEPRDGADEERGDDLVAHDEADTGADPDQPPAGVTSLTDRRAAIMKSA